MKILARMVLIFSVSVLLLPWTLAAVNPQQERSLGVVLVESPLPPNAAAGIPAMNMVMIQQVLPNSPAGLAGLLPGDRIVSVDNSPVLSASDVTQWVEKRTAKEGVTLTIMRRGSWLGQYVPMPVRVLLPSPAVGSAPPPPAAFPSGFPPGSGSAKQGRPTLAWLGVKPNPKTQPVKVHFNDYRTCYVVAPPDWFVSSHVKEGNAVDVGAPDGSYAGWMDLGVHGFARRTIPSLATPEAWLRSVLSNALSGEPFHLTFGEPIQDELGYVWLPYVKDSKPPRRGVVIYLVLPVPNDPMGYIVISHTVETPKQIWENRGALALAVGFSIRCNVQLRPSPDGPRRPPSGEDRVESTYNQQLGTEYAHNPDTGETYWMNHASDWKETGPQGPGYYIQAGNEWKKLEEGLGK